MTKMTSSVLLIALLLGSQSFADNGGVRTRAIGRMNDVFDRTSRALKLSTLRLSVDYTLPAPNSSQSSIENLAEQTEILLTFISEAKNHKVEVVRSLKKMRGFANTDLGQLERVVEILGSTRVVDFSFSGPAKIGSNLSWYQFGRDILFYKAIYNSQSGNYLKMAPNMVRYVVIRGLIDHLY